MKAFQAYGTDQARVTRPTAKEAALAFFEQNPMKRKCDVVEGEKDGDFFTVACSLSGKTVRPQRWRDVTKKAALNLPEA